MASNCEGQECKENHVVDNRVDELKEELMLLKENQMTLEACFVRLEGIIRDNQSELVRLLTKGQGMTNSSAEEIGRGGKAPIKDGSMNESWKCESFMKYHTKAESASPVLKKHPYKPIIPGKESELFPFSSRWRGDSDDRITSPMNKYLAGKNGNRNDEHPSQSKIDNRVHG